MKGKVGGTLGGPEREEGAFLNNEKYEIIKKGRKERVGLGKSVTGKWVEKDQS